MSTAATPLGGDHIDIRVELEPGVRLCIGSVAATIALPSRHDPYSAATWTLTVADDAELHVVPQPTVVAAAATHETTTTLTAAGSSVVRVEERVQLGRYGEAGGSWSGRLVVDVDGVPALRHRLDLGDDAVAGAGHRALLSSLQHPDTRDGAVAPTAMATRMALAAGAGLTTALGRTVADAERAAATIPS
ncbi:urease accessory protein UreD [Williamsia deligens]|uniref:Urease accessory protein UreD n=1 Tax=Williamsia deligens TaxID=321325 RepID=A0ABW3GFI0_9NOCA|nr:urease accessory protein UreD [Williamsia deligens]